MYNVKLYCLQHVPYEGPEMIDPVLEQMGYTLKRIKLYNGDLLPDLKFIDYLIVLGGPMDMENEDRYPWLADEKKLIKAMIDAGKPILGICLGAQLIAHVLGHSVYPAEDHEIGWYPVRLTKAGRQHPATKNWGENPTVFHWHSNTFDLPKGAIHLASTDLCPNQAFILNENIIGLQFHLEIGHPQVQKMIDNWGRYKESGLNVQSPDEMLRKSKAAVKTQKMLYHLLYYWFTAVKD
ncbi:gamma-glutamyl-gamma-aminobutyrate hydrolase family protein [Aliifodinibius sp. S!AR15-10]|uniref:glutamine amidotransferase-related protein n=1 Tax=Aliifodinibius sp. S!AR15-10 TaxID=2950437 RepID=UPI00285718C1|nr:gamma-glutamyl-gamma-aminobutyrate hydrolase family protein [Aliifodinibius sp. S!AR15-10]MDR8390716.1 gamma-glutamyl-gamma-aminobutyrate hydrolase family protein [Aliifodinibius sp. S!AR15-10]